MKFVGTTPHWDQQKTANDITLWPLFESGDSECGSSFSGKRKRRLCFTWRGLSSTVKEVSFRVCLFVSLMY